MKWHNQAEMMPPNFFHVKHVVTPQEDRILDIREAIISLGMRHNLILELAEEN